jgi:hypothetical protein
MIYVFILTSLGLGLTVFYIMYKQVFAGIVKNQGMMFRHVLVLSLLYTLMLVLGYALSVVIIPAMIFPGLIISSVLFFILALKMYTGILKGRKHQWTFDSSQWKVLFLFSFSNAFDAFFAGIALGFYDEIQWMLFMIFWAVIALMVFMAFVMARRQSANLSVWIVALLGSLLMGVNMIIIVIIWLLSQR